VNLSRFVYKSHKWLSVAVGLFATLWFFSGMVMILPSPLLQSSSSAPPRVAPAAPPESFRDVKVSVPEAIAAADASSGHRLEIADVGFRRVLGRLVYALADADGHVHLIDATNGMRIQINEERARQIGIASVGGQFSARQVSLLQRFDWTYKYGPLPAYRLMFDDPAGSVLYVSAETGEVQFTSRLGRLRSLVSDAHTFGFLQPMVPGRWVQWALFVFAGVGFLLSLFGGWILWLQLDGWWRLHRRTT
jgi:hypothetical protein